VSAALRRGEPRDKNPRLPGQGNSKVAATTTINSTAAVPRARTSCAAKMICPIQLMNMAGADAWYRVVATPPSGVRSPSVVIYRRNRVLG